MGQSNYVFPPDFARCMIDFAKEVTKDSSDLEAAKKGIREFCNNRARDWKNYRRGQLVQSIIQSEDGDPVAYCFLMADACEWDVLNMRYPADEPDTRSAFIRDYYNRVQRRVRDVLGVSQSRFRTKKMSWVLGR